MKLTIVYNSASPSDKWLLRNENIGEIYLGSLIGFNEKPIKWKINHPPKKQDGLIESLSRLEIQENGKDETKWTFASRIRPTDRFRKLNLTEYILLGLLLKKYNTVYNKKRDEFIIK